LEAAEQFTHAKASFAAVRVHPPGLGDIQCCSCSRVYCCLDCRSRLPGRNRRFTCRYTVDLWGCWTWSHEE
jgi:hypothetical protein